MKMEPAKSFRELIVWQKSHQFVLTVYKTTRSDFPREEMYGLTSQFRRAAVPIAANIAEGFKKQSKADKARMFIISEGSLEECRYYIILAKDLGYTNNETLWEQTNEIGRLLHSYRTSLLTPIPNPRPNTQR
ncbi:MAG: four helix bundle protein [Planctomycetaceae bacterium]|nr:four helix bundle protein [Planctomycetaceae bacterium]